MFKIINYIHKTLYKYFFKNYIFIIFLNTISAILQTTGIGSVGILIGLFVKNNGIQNYVFEILSKINLSINENLITLYLSLTVLGLFIVGNLISFFSNFISQKFILNFEIELRKKTVVNFFNSSHKLKISYDKIFFENLWSTGIERYRAGVSLIIGIFSNIILLTLYAGIILYLDYKILITLLVIGIIFFGIYLTNKKILISNSYKENKFNHLHARIGYHVNHAFRDIIFLNLENQTQKELSDIVNKKKKISLENFILVTYPRHFLEVLIVILFIIFANFYNTNEGLTYLLPKMTVIFLSVWRSVPLINGIYRSFSSLNSIRSTLQNIVNEKYFIFKDVFKIEDYKKDLKKYNFKKMIRFKKVKFSYDKKNTFLFNLNLKKNDWTYVYGKSGSGKTTFFNLLSGQLKAESGNITFDEESLYKNFQNKFNILGYIHQNIIVFEGTIAENICFKKTVNKIEEKKIKEIYDICGLKQIVSFKNIFKKRIFLDAPNLSGGQRQRIGLARTLYNEPSILIMDESFNALDYKSELEIFQKIKKNYPYLTLLYASHRQKNKYFNKQLKIN